VYDSEFQAGQRFEAAVLRDLTRTQIVKYAGASGDFNRLHIDEVYATQVAGYRSVFAHGMLTMGSVGRLLTDTVGDGRLLSFGGRFIAQVWPGDTITAYATLDSVRDSLPHGRVGEFTVSARNQNGQEVFAGTATAALAVPVTLGG
jgi:acyl dehydratase